MKKLDKPPQKIEGHGNMYKKKISNKQREEITIYYYSHNITQAALAEMYGITQSTLNGIVNNPKWLKKARDYIDGEFLRSDIIKKLATIKAVKAAPDAIEQIIKIASQEVRKDNMGVQYVIQNACNEILNRAGIKAQDGDTNEITIRFADPAASFTPGTPELEASEMIDVTNSVEGGDVNNGPTDNTQLPSNTEAAAVPHEYGT